MEREQRTDRFTTLEERFAGYEVYDPSGEKIGKVDDLFLDENDQPEYIGVKMGFLGTSSTLIPVGIATIEEQVRSYYGFEGTQASEKQGGYGAHYGDSEGEHPGEVGPGMMMGDTESGEFRGHGREQEGLRQSGSDLEDQDELRVQRTEEELRAGTREREAGALNVRKRVVTERERMEVPTRREEVTVERVPVEGEATEAEIGDDEVRIPVTEEEVVVEKRPVAKEELRIRKDVVEDTEVVEEDVRREEIYVEDDTSRRSS
jgi:uncharacterized protein (TIGR02271 family)